MSAPRRALPPTLIDPTALLDALDDYVDDLDERATRAGGERSLLGTTQAEAAARLRRIVEEHTP